MIDPRGCGLQKSRYSLVFIESIVGSSCLVEQIDIPRRTRPGRLKEFRFPQDRSGAVSTVPCTIETYLFYTQVVDTWKLFIPLGIFIVAQIWLLLLILMCRHGRVPSPEKATQLGTQVDKREAIPIVTSRWAGYRSTQYLFLFLLLPFSSCLLEPRQNKLTVVDSNQTEAEKSKFGNQQVPVFRSNNCCSYK